MADYEWLPEPQPVEDFCDCCGTLLGSHIPKPSFMGPPTEWDWRMSEGLKVLYRKLNYALYVPTDMSLKSVVKLKSIHGVFDDYK